MRRQSSIIFLVLFPIVTLGGLFYFLHFYQNSSSNYEKKPIEWRENQTQCSQCSMYLSHKLHSVQLVDTRGKTHFFDDIGCLVAWLRAHQESAKEFVIWVYSLDTHRYIDALKARYVAGEETPMRYGFGAYEKVREGSISFDELSLKIPHAQQHTHEIKTH